MHVLSSLLEGSVFEFHTPSEGDVTMRGAVASYRIRSRYSGPTLLWRGSSRSVRNCDD